MTDKTQCANQFRFARGDISRLSDTLQLPYKTVCCQGIRVNNIETLCILFKRLSHTCRLSDVVPPFGRNPTESVWYFITYSTLFTRDLLTSLVLGTKILYNRTTWNYIANQEPHCKIALGVLKEKFYIYLVQR